MSEASLLFYVSCHQTYRISLALRDPVPFVDSPLLYLPLPRGGQPLLLK